MKKKTIMVVDDEAINLTVLSNLLLTFSNVRAYKSGIDALEALKRDSKPDLILLDVMMPGLDGFETLKKINQDPSLRDIPVIFITSLDSPSDEDIGFRLGAVDYITKPFHPTTVDVRVKSHLELKEARDRLKNQNRWLEAEVKERTDEIRLVQTAAMTALMRLAETRDENTGDHIRRTIKYMEILARAMQRKPAFRKELTDIRVSSIINASPLHDIGKIGIPDAILRKPGKLTPEEFEVIKTHCDIGARTLNRAKNDALAQSAETSKKSLRSALLFLDEAEALVQSHHERWDGAGYPRGLSGNRIPLSARMMALVDVFDALTTERPYKQRWSMDEASSYIVDQKGKAFDPDIVDVFLEQQDAFHTVMNDFADPTEG